MSWIISHFSKSKIPQEISSGCFERNILFDHIKNVHEGQRGRRDYNCAECGKDFSTATVLKNHIECVHEGRRDYNCAECGKDFSTAHCLKRHIKCIHEKRKDSELVSNTDDEEEENSKIAHEINNVRMPESNCEPIDAIGENMEVKKEQLDTEEMPTFEHESTYLDNEIKKEIKIEPLESLHDGLMFKDHDNKRKSKDSSLDYSSSVHEKSREEQIENMVSNVKIKKEEIQFEEMPIFERDSTYLEQEIKKEIKIEPHI